MSPRAADTSGNEADTTGTTDKPENTDTPETTGTSESAGTSEDPVASEDPEVPETPEVAETPDALETTEDDLDLPSVLTERVRPPAALTRPPKHATTSAEARRVEVRRYLYRGRHRRPRPVYRALQATTALLMFTGVGAALAHEEASSHNTGPRSAVELAVGNQGATGPRTEALPATDPSATTKSTNKPTPSTTSENTEKPTKSPDKSTGESTGKSDKTTQDSSKTTTTKPARLLVDQAAAQPTDQVGTWLNQALGILKADGYSESQMNAKQIRAIIEHESADNPGAINLWDSNAAKGTPSKGLMQCIDPTFNQWSLPGHRDIWDPVDNIIAGVRYAVGTYGSISNVPGVVSMASGGSYQGY